MLLLSIRKIRKGKKMKTIDMKHLKDICSNCNEEFFKSQMIDMNDNPYKKLNEDWVCYLDGEFNSCYMQMVEANERED